MLIPRKKKSQGALQMSSLASYKKSSIYCFLNLLFVPYLCLHVVYPPSLASVNYCLTAQNLLKGQCTE